MLRGQGVDTQVEYGVDALCAIASAPQVTGVMAADVMMDAVVQNVASIKPTAASYAFLVDGGGKIIAHPDGKLTLKETALKQNREWTDADELVKVW